MLHFLRKLRDEYDKLEGALRKLGVDPETLVGDGGGGDDDDEDEAFGDDDDDDYDCEERRRQRQRRKEPPLRGSCFAAEQQLLHSQAAAAANLLGSGDEDFNLEDLDPLSLQNRTDRLRRHLDILEEVRRQRVICTNTPLYMSA